jgi:transposase
MNKINLLAIDIAKINFQLHGIDVNGNVVLRKKLTRNKLMEFIANLPSCTIVMEACGGANSWARKFTALGHIVKLISPQFVKPFVKTNKTDRNDAEAICEAASRPSMRFVSPKSIEQQDLQSLHRIRSLLVQERTATANQIRGLLMEYGLVMPQGIHNITKCLPIILADQETELSELTKKFLRDLYEQIHAKTTKIEEYDKLIESLFKQNKDCQKIAKIEGVGVLTATALIACIGDVNLFKNGRHLSAFLGLVPKQYSSGNKQKLLGISKRGNVYVRTLLIHGARSAVRAAGNKTDCKSNWIKEIQQRRGNNIAYVALANKTVRTIWAMLKSNKDYELNHKSIAA